MTSNTHRTEFCIDKMYARGGARDRLGLVVSRARVCVSPESPRPLDLRKHAGTA